MSNTHLRLTFLFLLVTSLGYAQFDDQKAVIKRIRDHEKKCAALIKLGTDYRPENPDSSWHYLNQALTLAVEHDFKLLEFDARNQMAATDLRLKKTETAMRDLEEIQNETKFLIKKLDNRDQSQAYEILVENYDITGNALRKQGKLDEAIVSYENAITLAEKHKLYEVLTGVYNDIAQTRYMQGLYPVSLDYCLKGIELNEKLNNKEGLASSTGNAGILFKEMGDFKKAIEYFEKALELNKALGNKKSIAVNLGNIGVGYGHLGEAQKSIEYYNRAIKIHEELEDESGLVYNYNNIGIEYTKLKKYDLSLVYFQKSFEILKKNPDDYIETFTHTSIASTYISKGDYNMALEHLLIAKKKAESMNTMDQMVDVYKALTELYEKRQELQKALDYYRLYIKYRDTIINEENLRNTISLEENFKYKQRLAQDSLINTKEKQLSQSELERKNAELEKNTIKIKAQKNYMYFMIGGLVLLIVFMVIVYNRFKYSQQQNAIINEQKAQVEFQKNLVDAKQKEIIDSINYAQRIQQAILSTPEDIKKYLPESFLLYKPKDIVAGDFYFFEATNSHLFLAAADCTGHGVPGALISVVCANALTRCVNEFRLTDPGEILNKTRELVLETLRKSGSDVKDGMDISLVVLKPNNKNGTLRFEQITWAGANNPLWYSEENSIKEIHADKQSIGQSYNPKPFTTHHVTPLPGSWLFLFTDGYADQFGGPEGKKFKYSNLQRIFAENRLNNPDTMKNELSRVFEEWKGELEQIDDVCIIGVRL